MFHPDAGVVDPDRAMTAMLRHARHPPGGHPGRGRRARPHRQWHVHRPRGGRRGRRLARPAARRPRPPAPAHGDPGTGAPPGAARRRPVAGLHLPRCRERLLRPARGARRRGARRGEAGGAPRRGGHHGGRPRRQSRPGRPRPRGRVRGHPPAGPRPPARRRVHLPVHDDRERGLHPGPPGPVRDRLALLWSRREVRAPPG
jgi:hypothetical protein